MPPKRIPETTSSKNIDKKRPKLWTDEELLAAIENPSSGEDPDSDEDPFGESDNADMAPTYMINYESEDDRRDPHFSSHDE